MKDFFSTYWAYIKIYFKAKAEYRTSFILGLVSNFYCYFITYISYWVLTNGTRTIAGWDFEDLSILYGMSLLTYAISGTLLWYTIYHLEELIISGLLDIMLIRPQGIIRQMIFQHFGDTFLGQIIVTIIFLVTAFVNRVDQIEWYTLVYFGFAILGGILIQSGSMILFGSISFWTMKSAALIDFVFYDLRDMTKYPLNIYPRIFRGILTFVMPWAFINYYPAIIITGKSTNVFEWMMGILAPIVGIVWFGLSILIFKMGLRRYTGAGN